MVREALMLEKHLNDSPNLGLSPLTTRLFHGVIKHYHQTSTTILFLLFAKAKQNYSVTPASLRATSENETKKDTKRPQTVVLAERKEVLKTSAFSRTIQASSKQRNKGGGGCGSVLTSLTTTDRGIAGLNAAQKSSILFS